MRVVALLLVTGCADLWNIEYVESIDAGPADASFEPDRECPSDYQLALFAGSRYRITPDSFAAWDDSDDCNDDKVGITHLAVAQTRTELDNLIDALGPTGIGSWWLGLVQRAGAATPNDGWIWVTGETVDPALWDGPSEPNDGDGTENATEQFGDIISNVRGLIDYDGSGGKRALCECDGRAMSAEAKTAIELSRR